MSKSDLQLYENGILLYHRPAEGDPVIPPVEPPPGGGGGTTPPPSGMQPPYAGTITWNLGAPGEVSPSAVITHVNTSAEYAASVTKVNDGTTLRIQAARDGPWWEHVHYCVPGVLPWTTVGQQGGSSECYLRGAPNQPNLIVLIRMEGNHRGGPEQGTIAPQVIAL